MVLGIGRFQGSYAKPVRTLLSVFEVTGYLTNSRLLRFLVERFEAVVFDVEFFVELEWTEKLAEYNSAMTEKRRQADADGNEVLASFAKVPPPSPSPTPHQHPSSPSLFS